MSLFFAVDRKPQQATTGGGKSPKRHNACIDPGEGLFQAGAEGLAWRVRNGVVRLDTPDLTGRRDCCGWRILA